MVEKLELTLLALFRELEFLGALEDEDIIAHYLCEFVQHWDRKRLLDIVVVPIELELAIEGEGHDVVVVQYVVNDFAGANLERHRVFLALLVNLPLNAQVHVEQGINLQLGQGVALVELLNYAHKGPRIEKAVVDKVVYEIGVVQANHGEVSKEEPN